MGRYTYDMNLQFKLLFKIQGFPIDKALLEFEEIQKSDLSSRLVGQQAKAWDIFDYHRKNNRLYNNFIQNSRPAVWSQIPILTKKDIQASLEERLSSPYTRESVFINNTSGSSGTPFIFAKDKFCHAMCWATINDRFGQHGIQIGSSLQARFYGIPSSGVKYYKERLKDVLARRIRIPVFDLSDQKLEVIQKVFEKHNFEYVNGYTSSLVLFAKFLLKKKLPAKNICPSLKVVFTTSEVCDDHDREILERGFGVPVINEYGASELDLIAVQDVDGDWIVNNETLLVEIVDDNGLPVDVGTEGRVVVTSLYNKAMPFIRYDLGDLAVADDKIKGSYTVLKQVIGRTNDFALLPSGKKAAGLTFYYISKSLMDQGNIMKEFIIKQISLTEFLFEYVSERELSNSEKKEVQKALDTYLEPGLTAMFERKEFLERTKAGKLKHFFNLVGKQS